MDESKRVKSKRDELIVELIEAMEYLYTSTKINNKELLFFFIRPSICMLMRGH